MGRLTKEEIEYIKNHPECSNYELAKMLNHDRHVIGKYKEKFGIAFSQLHKFDNWNNYIIENYYKKTARELAQEIGCSKQYIQKIWSNNGLKGKVNRSYYCNYDYFHTIDSSDKAYIVGLIASDGNVYKRDGHQGQLGIILKRQDENILQKILKVMDSNHPIHYGATTTTETASIVLVSDILFNDLNQIGICEKKTWIFSLQTVLNHIPVSFWKDFFRGYFDGDGSIVIKENSINTSHISYAIPAHNAKTFLEALEKIAHEKYSFILDKRKNYYQYPFGQILATNTTTKYLLLKLFYYNNPFLYLERKKVLAEKLIWMIENNITNRSENITAVTKWGELLKSLE